MRLCVFTTHLLVVYFQVRHAHQELVAAGACGRAGACACVRGSSQAAGSEEGMESCTMVDRMGRLPKCRTP